MTRILLLLACLLTLTKGLWAQAVSGTIVGTVLDSSGGVVPDAGVSILESNTNQSRSTNTNESGNFSFVNLPTG
jgi:hypothetical protein